MLDLKMLEAMPPHTVFATEVVNLTRLWKDDVRWVAVKGGINDWAIYYHKKEKSVEFICREGDKVFTKEVIRELVECTDEVFEAYRY
jgi:hypothetical protein